MTNFIKKLEEIQKAENPKKLSKLKTTVKKTTKLIVFFMIFFLVGITIFTNRVSVSSDKKISWFSNLPIIKQIKNLAESADQELKGDTKGRTNILLLGMGGEGHEGGLLTDTLMLSSLELEEKKVAMMSIPRDLSVKIEDVGWRKINHVNAYAESDKAGSGGLAVSQAVSDILSLPIDYYIRIDFDGFKNILDRIGGIEVYVDNTLDDYRYPIKGRETDEDFESRYEHLHIEQGWQKMDGTLALKYARSRHAMGVEGSDFARSKRQQKVIQAVKDKLLSLQTLFNPKLVIDIIKEVDSHISTNLKVWEILKLWNDFKDIEQKDITTKVLDNGPNGLLTDTINEEAGYLLVPRSGDFSEIQYMVNNIFTDIPISEKNQIVDEMATVEVRNGTWINGLASERALDLEQYGFKVIRVGNSSRQNFQKSVIYDLTYGEKENSLSILKGKTGANVSFGLPDWLLIDIEKELTLEKNPIQPDFILILGQEADATASGAENVEE